MDFEKLMIVHISSARSVVVGKYSGKKSLINKGLKGLEKNSEHWGDAMAELLYSNTRGATFERLWKKHVKLEGDYIGAVFSCPCRSKDFGTCAKAKAASKALSALKRNGTSIINFLNRQVGKNKKWKVYWMEHLQCVKDFIDDGVMVKCRRKSRTEFKKSVKHCIRLGKELGRALNKHW